MSITRCAKPVFLSALVTLSWSCAKTDSNPLAVRQGLEPASSTSILGPTAISVKGRYTWSAVVSTESTSCDNGAWYLEDPAGGTASGPYSGTTTPEYVAPGASNYYIKWYFSMTCTYDPEYVGSHAYVTNPEYNTATTTVHICTDGQCGIPE